ncbi:MAG TPA: hypothetical protein VF984_10255, partial [Actinomycetota bacterium]
MAELRNRLREADRVSPPDLWAEIGARAEGITAPLPNRPPDRAKRFLTATLAFAVFAASGVLVWRALRPTPRPPASETPAPPGDPWASYGEGWTQLPAPPEPRQGATLAWAGDELLYWGGVRSGDTDYAPTSDGYAFDPVTGAWRPIPPSPVPGKYTRAVWTGTEAIFWGAQRGQDSGLASASGLAFDPATERWHEIPSSPHQPSFGGALVWTGSELISWGGGAPGDPENTQGAAYDPETDMWRRIADAPIGLNLASGVWTGHEMIVLGSLLNSRNIASTSHVVGAAYDPTTDSWHRIAPSELSPQASSAVWTGDRMVAWDYAFKAAEYFPDRDEWRPLPDVPGESGECYVDSAVVEGTVFAWDCGYAATLPPGATEWDPVNGGVTEPTVTANDQPYRLFRFAQLVPAGDVLAMAAEGITVGDRGTSCYGCRGAPMSFWVFRPIGAQAPPATAEQAYLPPHLAGGDGWYTHESAPAPDGDATVAWASTVPFARSDLSLGAAIPPDTITSLSPNDVLVTVETTPWTFDPSSGPYPYEATSFDLAQAARRGPEAEEPTGRYTVLEIDDPAALIRVYLGSDSPDPALVERAQHELDTLQLPPVCPIPAHGPYGMNLSVNRGVSGEVVTITGPMPFQREDGTYAPDGDAVMIAWWNGSPEAWESLLSFSTASPSPGVAGSPVLRLGEGGRSQCSFSIT